MSRFSVIGAFAVAVVTLAAGEAMAYSAPVCLDKVKGMRRATDFVVDQLNAPAGSDRMKVIIDAFNGWNAIPAVAHRFNIVNGDSDDIPEGNSWVHFRSRSNIDNGANGMMEWDTTPCAPPYSMAESFNIRISIANDLSLAPADENATDQNARGLLRHEMGHALGGDHFIAEPNMLYNPGWGSLRAGSRMVDGTLRNLTDTFVGDDAAFGLAYHADGSFTAPDYIVSALGFNVSSKMTYRLNFGDSLVCPGQVVSFAFTYANFGTSPWGSSSANVWLDVVLSTNSTISNADLVVLPLTVSPIADTWYTPSGSITIPSAPVGTTWWLGAVIDPTSAHNEFNEGNNSVYLGKRYIIKSGC